MPSYDDPFSDLDASEQEDEQKKPKSRPTKREDFEQPIELQRRDAARATGRGESVYHGNYYQLTTRLPEGLVDEIRRWAADLNMTQQDVQRYCFYRGLEALEEGERPEFEEVVVQKKLKRPE
jgi:hypothetical protein